MTTKQQNDKRLAVRKMKNRVAVWSHDIGLGRPIITQGGIVHLANGTKMTLAAAYELAEAYF